VTMPPAPRADSAPESQPGKTTPRKEPPVGPVDAPPPATTRPREVDTQKKKGKKGGDEPPE